MLLARILLGLFDWGGCRPPRPPAPSLTRQWCEKSKQSQADVGIHRDVRGTMRPLAIAWGKDDRDPARAEYARNVPGDILGAH